MYILRAALRRTVLGERDPPPSLESSSRLCCRPSCPTSIRTSRFATHCNPECIKTMHYDYIFIPDLTLHYIIFRGYDETLYFRRILCLQTPIDLVIR